MGVHRRPLQVEQVDPVDDQPGRGLVLLGAGPDAQPVPGTGVAGLGVVAGHRFGVDSGVCVLVMGRR